MKISPDFSRFKCFMFDLDGVVWRGTKAIENVPETINFLKTSGRTVRFLTNNASEHREYQQQKLKNLGVDAELEEVTTAGSATADYIRANYGEVSVHVMGNEQLEREMKERGLNVVERGAQIVVTGLDKSFTWSSLDLAFQNISVDGAKFIAANADPVYPSHEANHPGAGCAVAALACAVGRAADAIVGKPNSAMFNAVLGALDLQKEECLMIGDKLMTDISGAKNTGISAALVLSGIDTRESIEGSSVTPDFVISSAAELCERQ